jgi:hypothetical protein
LVLDQHAWICIVLANWSSSQPSCAISPLKGCSRCKFYIIFPCRRGRDQLTMHRVHITPYVVSSNPAHGEIYSIQHLHDHDNEKLFVIHKNIFYLFKGLYYFWNVFWTNYAWCSISSLDYCYLLTEKVIVVMFVSNISSIWFE